METTASPGRVALEDLARHGLAGLRRSAARIVGGADAEDVVQDAFVRVLEAGGAARAPARLVRVATGSLALDRLRRRRLRRGPGARPEDDEVERLEAPAPDPERVTATAQELVRIAAALGELPGPVRQALLLSRLEGVPHLELAARLHLSPKTVERHIARALRHCMARLRPGWAVGAGPG